MAIIRIIAKFLENKNYFLKIQVKFILLSPKTLVRL